VSWRDLSLCIDTDCCVWVADLGPFVDERLPKFWEGYIKNRELPADTRKSALIAWLWVRILLDSGLLDDWNFSRL